MSEAQAPRLTRQQSAPLEIRDASVALSAGAGCGKTTVLTEGFLRALDAYESRPLRRLVALTFTQKAARELRQRIRAECHRRLAGAADEDVKRWRDVLRGLEAAPIGTFHEYCGRLLRRHALEAGLDPDFEVLDEAIASSIGDEALGRCLRRWLAEPRENLVDLAAEFGLAPVQAAIGRLMRANDLAALHVWTERSDIEILGLWREAFATSARDVFLKPLHAAVRACLAWHRDNPLDHAKLRAFQQVATQIFPEVLEREPGDWLQGVREAALLPKGLRAANWPSPQAQESGGAVHKALREAIDGYFEKAVESRETTEQCLRHGRAYVALAAEARDEYERAKQRLGGLDFDDLLTKTRDLLRDHPAIARGAADDGVAFVLVDEFQDTDPVQSEILSRLGGDDPSSVRMFVVGDPKQSIYRFRGAQPEIFQILRESFPSECRLDLTENFRSAPPVIDFVNALFADAFPAETPRLLPGPFAYAASPGPAVEFVWACEPRPEADGPRPRETSDEQRRVEARWLARLVRERLDAGWRIVDRKTRTPRDAHAGDVAFLFRAMTDLAAYERALDAEGLDYHVVGGKAFYAQDEIQDVVNVLSVIEDPLDGVSLAGALRGPFFGVSDEGLFWLGQPGRNALAPRFAAVTDPPELSEADRTALDRARRLLARWRAMKDRQPIALLLERVLAESGFEAALLAERLGDRKRANARKLVRLARRFDAQGGFTLGLFVARLRADLRVPPREDQAATTDEEGQAVRLLSIHQSKGLEFPIVVVPDLNRKSGPSRDGVVVHPTLGPLVRPGRGDPGSLGAADDAAAEAGGTGRSLGWLTYEALERDADEAESRRLFYVATTRARDALILSAGAPPDVRPQSAAMRLLDERFDRATGELRVALPDGWAPPEVRVVTTLDAPPEPPGRRARVSLTGLADVILTARPRRGEEDETRRPPPPRFVDLDDLTGLSARGVRLSRLIRSMLADPRLLFPGALREVAGLAARRQSPLAHDDLVDDALALLAPALDDPETTRILATGARQVDAAWSATWPPEARRGTVPTVFRGRTEFFLEHPEQGWTAVVVSLPGAWPTGERLRLLLSPLGADALGLGPVTRGVHIRLGLDGPAFEEVDYARAGVVDEVREAFRRVVEGAGSWEVPPGRV